MKSAAEATKPGNGKRRGPRRKSKSTTSAAAAPKHSETASRRAAVILEVLGGIHSPGDAARLLGISVNYYYVLERKALRGLVAACEPAAKGPPGPSPEKRLARLQQELDRCRRDCQRQAALVRATQSAVGLPAAEPKPNGRKRKPAAKTGKHRRSRKPNVRALLAAESLKKNSGSENSANVLKPAAPEIGTVPPPAITASLQEVSHDASGQETVGRRTR